MSVDTELAWLEASRSASVNKFHREATMRLPPPSGSGPIIWLTSGGLSLQIFAVVAGCSLTTVVVPGVRAPALAVVIPALFIVAAHPKIHRGFSAVFRRIPIFRNRRTLHRNPRLRRPSAMSGRRPRSLDHGDGETSENLLLRSFDRFQELLDEALVLEVGDVSGEFELRDTVAHLRRTGFLTPHDLHQWATCLSVRRSLLLSESDETRPSSEDVERSLSTMMQLQVTLTDRRRRLFARHQLISQREEERVRQAKDQIG